MAYPPPQNGAPTSFKTNVNRAKTKRWVEAKSYSYDGDDWGDAEEYDDYDEPPPPIQSKPTGLRQRGQSATQAAQVHNEYHVSASPTERQGTVGAALKQQHHGTRSATNPQPQLQFSLPRANSFDRGDERRAFSGPGPHQNRSSPVELAQPSTFQEETPIQESPHKGLDQSVMVTKSPGQPVSARQTPYEDLPNQQVWPPPSSFPDVFNGKEKVESPIEAQGSIQIEPKRQNLRLQSHFDRDQHPHRSQQNWSPTGNDRVLFPLEQGPQANFGSRSQSITSNESSPDYQHRRDLSQSGTQPLFHPGGFTSSGDSSESVSSSKFPPRKSSLSHRLPRLNQTRTVTPLTPPGGEQYPLRDKTDNADSRKPPTFVRPADIYKRMHEGKERDKPFQDPSPSGLNANTGNKADSSTPSTYGFGSADARTNMDDEKETTTTGTSRVLPQSVQSVSDLDRAEESHERIEAHSVPTRRPNDDQLHAEAGFDNTSRPLLPDVTRMSSFGDIFTSTTPRAEESSNWLPRESLNESSYALPPGPTGHPTQTDLQHQPSVGLRSAVHHAFDTAQDQIPATPSSKADSGIARSTSGRTSVISPIISRGPSISRATADVEKTQTPSTPPVQSDENSVDKSIPSTFATPKQMYRKASSSQTSGQIIDEILPPNFVQGHRRNTSTPSPNNSPARTPVLESSKLGRQPQEVELAVATPMEPTFSENSGSPIASPNESSTNFGDTEAGRQPADLKPLHPEAELSTPFVPRAIDASIKRQGESVSGSPIMPPKDPTRSRPDSPSKNRVRDLAEKFESNASSRRGSNHSISQSTALLNSGTHKADDASPTRLVADRGDSFRPRLPGAWESFASNAPKRASMSQIEKEGEAREQLMRPLTRDGSGGNSPAQFTPFQIQSNAAKENLDVPSNPKVEHDSQNALTAAATAGAALAGALAAAVGIRREGPPSEPENEEQSDGKDDEYPTEPRSRNFSVDTVLHPEASRPLRPESTGDDGSSGPPTPPSDIPTQTTDYVEGDLRPVTAADSLETPETSNIPVVPSSLSNRSQAMLPPLSTDTMNHQYDSDRLRREIVKNLSPQGASEPTTGESEFPSQDGSRLSADPYFPAHGHDSMVIPKEYESYWNGSNNEGDVSRSSSHLGRPPSSASSNQARDAQIIPPKPLQFARAARPKNNSTLEKTSDASMRPTLASHQYLGEKELVGASSPAHQSSSRNPGDISQHVREDDRGGSELPAAPVSPDIGTQPHQPEDRNFHSAHGDLRASIEPNLPASNWTTNSTAAEIEGRTQYYGGISQPTNAAIHGLGSPSSHSRVQEQPALKGPPSNFGQTYPEPIDVYATAPVHIGNWNSTPVEHQSQTEMRPTLPRTPDVVDNDSNFLSPSLYPSAQPKIRAFREIMALKTPEERIQAFDKAREQIANQSTGLGQWLAVKSKEFPEHADVFSGSQRPFVGDIGHKSSASRSILSGLRPAGATAFENSKTLGTGGSQVISPGGGGKTTSHNVQAKTKELLHSAGLFGAKGLFSKRKSKLRGSSGVDKVSFSAPSSDLISRGMPLQSQPQAGPKSLYPGQFPKEEYESSPLSSPPLGPSTSLQDRNEGAPQIPPQFQYYEGSQRNDTATTQDDQSRSSQTQPQPPASSSPNEDGRIPQQRSAQSIPQNEFEYDKKNQNTDLELSKISPKRTPDGKSEHTATYVNLNPTQADFINSGQHGPAHSSLPMVDGVPSRPKSALDASYWKDQRRPEAPMDPQNFNRDFENLNMFQADDDPKQPWKGSERNNNLEQRHQSPPRPGTLLGEERSPSEGAPLTIQPIFLPGSNTQSQQKRPFSFMELTSGKNQLPIQDVLEPLKRDGQNPGGNHFDRDTSSVSPERSPRDIQHRDYSLLSEKQLELLTQSPSSHHFRDPNIHQHPALRHEASPEHSSSARTYKGQHPTEKPRQVSDVHDQSFTPAVPPHGTNIKSWPGPSGPLFSPTLSAPTVAEKPTPFLKQGNENSHYSTPVPESKSKRASILRSLNGRGGDNRDRSRDTSGMRDSPLATNTQQKANPAHLESIKVGATKTSESSKALSKLHRASTSVVADQGPSKKKRFSVLGSIFGRSNQEKTRPKSHAVHSNPLVEHPTSATQSKAVDSGNFHPGAMQQRQDYYFAPQDYYAQPPQGGYYAPGNQFNNPSYQTPQPVRQAYPKIPEPPAYMQDMTLRQGNSPPSHHMTTGGKRPPTTTPPQASSQSVPRADSWDRRYSAIPAPGREALYDSPFLGRTSSPPNRPQGTGHAVSASHPRSEVLTNTIHQESYFRQHWQQRPTYSVHEAHQISPYPPAPPPKDECRSDQRQLSCGPDQSTRYQSPPSSPSPFPRIPLPPIHTSIPTTTTTATRGGKTDREKAEMRMSRQMEIEHGISRAESSGGNEAGVFMEGLASRHMKSHEDASEKELVRAEEEQRPDSADDDIVMSSTSYPGMEWQPREFSRWNED